MKAYERIFVDVFEEIFVVVVVIGSVDVFVYGFVVVFACGEVLVAVYAFVVVFACGEVYWIDCPFHPVSK